MTRIATPATVAEAPAASQPLLETVNRQLGAVPNQFRMVGNSPAALEGCLNLKNALGKGELSAQTRERIALAVAEVNGCDYSLSAHIYFARNVAARTIRRPPPPCCLPGRWPKRVVAYRTPISARSRLRAIAKLL
jgi:AhpD family alkylhydroperoxidase